jgi:hypothetical protein
LTRAHAAAAGTSLVFRLKEALMLALYDQIQQLRAELGCNPCPAERANIMRDLEAAEAAHAQERGAFEVWFEPPD